MHSYSLTELFLNWLFKSWVKNKRFQNQTLSHQGSVGVCGRGWLGLGRVCDPGCYTGQSPAIHWMWDFIPSNLSHIPIACELILKRPDSPQPLRMMFLSGLGMIEVLNSSH